MTIKTLYLLAALSSASALVPAPGPASASAPVVAAQHPMKSAAQSEFRCDLPPVLDPAAKDSLPSATDLFSSQRVLFDQNLKPILLTAHQDVVPAQDDGDDWTYQPFSGHWDGEYLWGRGAVDDKSSLTAIMSIMETLLSNRRWRPRRTVILAFGFDEECSGSLGAGRLAAHLWERYGDDGLAIVLDEGGSGIETVGDVVYALPAVYEKGYLDLTFDLSVSGGHSSTPPPHTSIGIMAEIVTALEAAPFEPELLRDGPLHHRLLCQARYSPDAQPELTELLRNGDLVGAARFVANQDRTSRYKMQTSQAVDVIRGGQKINALPETTTLGVNYRVAPQDSILSVQHAVARRVQDVVAKHGIRLRAFQGDDSYAAHLASLTSSPSADEDQDKNNVNLYNGTLILRAMQASHPSPVSPSSGPVWDVFAGTIRHSLASGHETVVPAAETMTGNTDMRYYLGLTPNIYRWRPIARNATPGIHTVDERIRMVDHMGMLRFYYDLVRNFDAADV
ncbi:hypothetical protein E4U21_006114 [Claviceps maximensis]|nr:hypothetical protein E4U21_006114 [Claviceps maximensis]